MATSGMRYQKVMDLVTDLEEKRKEISDYLLNTIAEERSAEVAQVYDGTAAENFKSNMRTVAETVDTDINSIVEQLKTEAETQRAAYLQQESNLQSNINVG